MQEQAKTDGTEISKTMRRSVVGLFIILSFIAFGASLWHGFSMIDDPYLVQQNLAIRGPTLEHLRRIFTSYDPELYIPLTLFSYQLNFLVSGLDAGFYHFTNILIHGLNGALVAWVLLLLTKKRKAALIAGLLWLVHPLNTEAVVWIAGRKDLLSTFFALGSTIAFLLYRGKGERRLYWISLAMFTLGLLSKATIFTLPVVFLLFDFAKREGGNIKSVRKTVPFFALGLVFLVVALYGKTQVVLASSYLETFIMAGKSTAFYLQKLLMPMGLTVFYPYQKAITISSPDFYLPWIGLVLLGVAALLSLRKTRWGIAALLTYLILLAPTYFNFHKGTQIFFAVDRYAYLPSLGFLLLVVFAADWVGTYAQEKMFYKTARKCTLGVTVLLVAVLGGLSIRQTAYWMNDETLLDHALALYPDSGAARISLSVVYRQEGRTDAERKVLTDGLAQMPTVAYYTGLGSIDARENNLDSAEKNYHLGRMLDPKNPEPLFYLGSLEEQRGNIDAAIRDYKEAVALDPSYVAAYNNLGGIYQDQRNYAEAEEQFKLALAQNPNFMEGQYNLFQILMLQHKNEEALPHLFKAYELNPDSSDIAISYAYNLSITNKKEEAKKVLERMLEVDPNDRQAKHMLKSLK